MLWHLMSAVLKCILIFLKKIKVSKLGYQCCHSQRYLTILFQKLNYSSSPKEVFSGDKEFELGRSCALEICVIFSAA